MTFNNIKLNLWSIT